MTYNNEELFNEASKKAEEARNNAHWARTPAIRDAESASAAYHESVMRLLRETPGGQFFRTDAERKRYGHC